MNKVVRRLGRAGRHGVQAGLHAAALPTRRVVRGAIRLVPSLGPQVADWSWLWQPGWGRQQHDTFFGRAADVYGFDTQPFEQMKYEELLAAIPGGRYERALEVGCAEGAFTERLVGRCDRIVATDISEVAIRRTRRRFADRPSVDCPRRTLPLDCSEGTFDLIVCSDVLYFWERWIADLGLRLLVRRLRPGGALVLLHHLGSFRQTLHADDVHDAALRIGVGPHGAGFRVHVLVRHG